jgi:hypothetical protein
LRQVRNVKTILWLTAFWFSVDARNIAVPDATGQLVNGHFDRIFPGADAQLLLDGVNTFHRVIVKNEFAPCAFGFF